MTEEAPEAERTPGVDLEYLVGVGATPVTLERCAGLAGFVLNGLDVYGALRPGQTGVLLYRVMSDVIDEQRQEAFRRRGEFKPRLAVKTPCCQVAAAGELLRLTDNDLFEQFKEYRINQIDNTWQELLDKRDNQGEMAEVQLRAALWLWAWSAKTAAPDRRQPQLLKALEDTISVYLAVDTDDRRERLRALAISFLEPSEQNVTTAVIPDAVESDNTRTAAVGTPDPTELNVPARPQRRVSPVPETSAPSNPELQRRIERLAADVRRLLNDEDGQDNAADPIPLQVCWSLTAQYLSSHPAVIWGEDEQPPFSTGTFDAITDLFESIPSGRLVILGRGGAGKTVMARRLALGLLDRRPDSAVPVIFRLPSWDLTERISLRDWMAAQLIETYPALGKKIRNIQGARTLAAALVNGRHILPILDGLDEVASPHRATALERINDALRRDGSLILTSRPAEYVAAVEAGDVVTSAAVIELHDLTLDDLATYLPRTAPVRGQADTNMWSPALAQLREPSTTGGATLREVLTTPLMASLARAVYSRATTDPAELLDSERFPDAGAITNHLLDAFVRVRYSDLPHDQDTRPRQQWKPADARRWLGFLAVMMSTQGTYDFAWWKLPRLFDWPRRVVQMLTLFIGVGLIIVWLIHSDIGSAGSPDTVGLAVFLGALACALIFSSLWASRSTAPWELRRSKRRWTNLFTGVSVWQLVNAPLGSRFAPVNAFIFAIPVLWVAFGHSATGQWEGFGLESGLVVALTSVAMAYSVCLTITPVVSPSATEVNSPILVFQNDRRAAIARGLYFGIWASALCATIWVPIGRANLLIATPFIVLLVFVGVVCSSVYGAWLIRRTGFAVVGLLPRSSRCMSFLDDACARGVLRQSGGTYQFRHAVLQEWLATDFLGHHMRSSALHRTILDVRSRLAVTPPESDSDGDASAVY